MTIADDEHDLLVEIQDWIFLNADEYKDGQMTDIEVIKDIYARLHKIIDENAKMLEALNELLDGLDANGDERCGLSEEQWEKRIRNARLAIAEAEQP